MRVMFRFLIVPYSCVNVEVLHKQFDTILTNLCWIVGLVNYLRCQHVLGRLDTKENVSFFLIYKIKYFFRKKNFFFFVVFST